MDLPRGPGRDATRRRAALTDLPGAGQVTPRDLRPSRREVKVCNHGRYGGQVVLDRSNVDVSLRDRAHAGGFERCVVAASRYETAVGTLWVTDAQPRLQSLTGGSPQ